MLLSPQRSLLQFIPTCVGIMCRWQHRQSQSNRFIPTCVGIMGERNKTFSGQQLLVATGREPNTDKTGLENVDVQLDERGLVKVNDELQTNVPHIWAAGDVIGSHPIGSGVHAPALVDSVGYPSRAI